MAACGGGAKAAMKRIQAIIKPSKLEAVKEALHKVGVHGMTVWEVKGFGRQRGHKEIYRGSEREVEFVPKTAVEAIVRDGMVDATIEAIIRAARTGNIGDGKIFVSDLADVVRIRTGETGDAAV
jgi:nitrogen regulatory protein P-II 1